MEKYGFVYIWYNKIKKKYYIGCHWGDINDGYICSSKNMRMSYLRNPQNFKRRILKSNINDRKQLLIEEYRYLQMIKDNELGVKYYNLDNHHFSHWSSCDKSLLTTVEKRRETIKNNPNYGSWAKGKPRSPETIAKIKKARSKQIFTKESQLKKSETLRKLNRDYITDEWKQNISDKTKKTLSSEYHFNKRSQHSKRLHQEGKTGMKGKKHSPETIQKMKSSALSRSINNKKNKNNLGEIY